MQSENGITVTYFLVLQSLLFLITCTSMLRLFQRSLKLEIILYTLVCLRLFFSYIIKFNTLMMNRDFILFVLKNFGHNWSPFDGHFHSFRSSQPFQPFHLKMQCKISFLNVSTKKYRFTKIYNNFHTQQQLPRNPLIFYLKCLR